MDLPKGNSLPLVRPFSDEWAILQFLKRWTPGDVAKAIDDDVDLADLMLRNWMRVGLLRTIAKRNSGNLESYLSPENILDWFACRRPDLHSEIVKNPMGVSWLTKNFSKIKEVLNI